MSNENGPQTEVLSASSLSLWLHDFVIILSFVQARVSQPFTVATQTRPAMSCNHRSQKTNL